MGELNRPAPLPGAEKQKSPPPKRRVSKKMRRRLRNRRRVLWGLCALLLCSILYTVIGRVGVPWLFRSVVLERLEQATGLKMKAERLTFNPWNFTFSGSGLRFAEASRAPLLSIDSVSGNLAPLALTRAEWVCHRINISGAKADIRRHDNGRYNIESLVDTWSRSRNDGIMNFSGLPFYFSLNNIAIDNSQLIFSDLAAGNTHSIENISLRLPTIANFDAGSIQHLPPAFSAVIDGTPVTIESEGEGVQSTLSTTIKNLNLARYARFIPAQSPFLIRKGWLNGSVELGFHSPAENDRTLHLACDLTLTELELAARKGVEQIALKRAQIKGAYNSITNTITVSSAALEHPTITAPMPKITSTVKRLFRHIPQPGGSDNSKESIPKTSVLTLIVNQLKLGNGTLLLRGREGTQGWHNIEFTAENLHADNSHPETAQAGASGNFSLTAERMARTAEKGGKKTAFRFSLRGLMAPYHRTGLPQIHDAWFSADNFHSINDIGSSFGRTPATGRALTLTARKMAVGPIDNRKWPLQLGEVTVTGSRLSLSPQRLPKSWLLGLALPLPVNCEALRYEGDLTLNLSRDNTPFFWNFSPFILETRQDAASGQNTINWRAVLADERDQLESAAIEGRGQIALHPFSLKSRINFKDLRLDRELSFLSLARDPGQPTIAGRLAGSGILTLPRFSWQGRLFVSDGSLATPEQTLVTWKKLAAGKIRYSRTITGSEEFKAGDVHLYDPHFILNLTANSSPMRSFSQIRSAAVKALPGALNQVRSLNIDNGRLTITDSRTTPPWQGTVEDLSLSVRPFFGSSPSSFKLTGTLAGGSFTARGTASLDNPESAARVVFSTTAIPLAPFAGQLERGGQLRARTGSATMNLNTLWMGGRGTSRGSITLKGLKAQDPKSNTAAALALLNARKGGFQIQLNVDNSQQKRHSTLETVVRRVQSALLRGLVAPLMVDDPKFENIATRPAISFAPGSSTLSAENLALIKSYATLLRSSPKLQLELETTLASAEDRATVKKGAATAATIKEQLAELADRRTGVVVAALRDQINDEAVCRRLLPLPPQQDEQGRPEVRILVHELGIDKTEETTER